MSDYFLQLHHISRYGLLLLIISLILLLSLFLYRFFAVNLTQDFDRQIKRAKNVRIPMRILWGLLITGCGMVYYGSTLSTAYLFFGRQVGEREWGGYWDIKPAVQSFYSCKDKYFQTNQYKFQRVYVEAYSAKQVGVWVKQILFMNEQQVPMAVIDFLKGTRHSPFLEQLEGKLRMLETGDTCTARVSLSCSDASCLDISAACTCASFSYQGIRVDTASITRRKYGL